ncbi:MAG: hypothetical protein ACI9KE_002013 [Polyangiales bacterium]|jgi:hypothetical protein
MRTREDIESYLMRANLSFKAVGDGEDEDIWLVRDTSSGENVVISLTGPLVLFRVRVMELDDVEKREGLFEKLLILNAEEMVHGAYGIEQNHIVLTAGLAIENLDYNEFQGVVDDITLALTNHYATLAAFRTSGAAGAE